MELTSELHDKYHVFEFSGPKFKFLTGTDK